MSEIRIKCCKDVSKGYGYRACGRNAKYERDGKWYCGMHDPVAKKARYDKRDAERRLLYESRRKHSERVAALQAQKDRCHAVMLALAGRCNKPLDDLLTSIEADETAIYAVWPK